MPPQVARSSLLLKYHTDHFRSQEGDAAGSSLFPGKCATADGVANARPSRRSAADLDSTGRVISLVKTIGPEVFHERKTHFVRHFPGFPANPWCRDLPGLQPGRRRVRWGRWFGGYRRNRYGYGRTGGARRLRYGHNRQHRHGYAGELRARQHRYRGRPMGSATGGVGTGLSDGSTTGPGLGTGTTGGTGIGSDTGTGTLGSGSVGTGSLDSRRDLGSGTGSTMGGTGIDDTGPGTTGSPGLGSAGTGTGTMGGTGLSDRTTTGSGLGTGTAGSAGTAPGMGIGSSTTGGGPVR